MNERGSELLRAFLHRIEHEFIVTNTEEAMHQQLNALSQRWLTFGETLYVGGKYIRIAIAEDPQRRPHD